MRTTLGSAALASLLVAATMSRPPAVSAECTFVAPWPDITDAIPSARGIVVGDVTNDFDPSELDVPDGSTGTEALRITAVLRGDFEIGDLLDTEVLLANWPWNKWSAETDPYPSCYYLQALPGERIAIAFDALMPARTLTNPDNITWNQPATRYNAMGVLVALEPSEGWGTDRERVTLAQLRDLAGMPATSTTAPAMPTQNSSSTMLVILAGLAAGLLVIFRRRSGDIA